MHQFKLLFQNPPEHFITSEELKMIPFYKTYPLSSSQQTIMMKQKCESLVYIADNTSA